MEREFKRVNIGILKQSKSRSGSTKGGESIAQLGTAQDLIQPQIPVLLLGRHYIIQEQGQQSFFFFFFLISE